MNCPIEVLLKNIPDHAGMESFVRTQAARLKDYEESIQHCRFHLDGGDSGNDGIPRLLWGELRVNAGGLAITIGAFPEKDGRQVVAGIFKAAFQVLSKLFDSGQSASQLPAEQDAA